MKEIYRKDSITSLVAEFHPDELVLPGGAPDDNVCIKVLQGDKELHGVFIGFDQLEEIYFAAKKAKGKKG